MTRCKTTTGTAPERHRHFLQEVRKEWARRTLLNFAKQMHREFEATPFHVAYYAILDAFAKGLIKKLIITVPPQHGKSEGSSRMLPAYMLGKNPDLRIGLVSYAANLAQKFNRSVQRYMTDPFYIDTFPESRIIKIDSQDIGTRTSYEFEILGRQGSLITAGREGGFTGNPLDVAILDDLYKNYEEANSPVVREKVKDAYINVIKPRLHNHSQELIVFTRWHNDDLVGTLEDLEDIHVLTSLDEIGSIDERTWIKVNFEATKESDPTPLDPRNIGEPLYPEKHNLESLEESRRLDPLRFDCLYQGDPQPKEGLLYGSFKTYDHLPATFANGNYTDTADAGDDYTCSVSYRKGRDEIYVTDIVYTQEDMEKTERLLPIMFERSDTRYSRIESNSGGRYFAAKVAKNTKAKVTWFHQSKNKESRILTNAATVTEKIIMPLDWQERWPLFARHVKRYKRLFRANKYHDGPDVLTGIVEKEVMAKPTGPKRRA